MCPPAASEDPLLISNDDRFCLFPVKHDDLWRMYKQAVASFWSVEEVSRKASV